LLVQKNFLCCAAAAAAAQEEEAEATRNEISRTRAITNYQNAKIESK